MVKLLVENGANINVTDDDAETPLHVAAEDGTLEIVKYLVEKGANVNAVNEDGRTPAEEAAREGNTAIAEFLRSCK